MFVWDQLIAHTTLFPELVPVYRQLGNCSHRIRMLRNEYRDITERTIWLRANKITLVSDLKTAMSAMLEQLAVLIPKYVAEGNREVSHRLLVVIAKASELKPIVDAVFISGVTDATIRELDGQLQIPFQTFCVALANLGLVLAMGGRI